MAFSRFLTGYVVPLNGCSERYELVCWRSSPAPGVIDNIWVFWINIVSFFLLHDVSLSKWRYLTLLTRTRCTRWAPVPLIYRLTNCWNLYILKLPQPKPAQASHISSTWWSAKCMSPQLLHSFRMITSLDLWKNWCQFSYSFFSILSSCIESSRLAVISWRRRCFGLVCTATDVSGISSSSSIDIWCQAIGRWQLILRGLLPCGWSWMFIFFILLDLERNNVYVFEMVSCRNLDLFFINDAMIISSLKPWSRNTILMISILSMSLGTLNSRCENHFRPSHDGMSNESIKHGQLEMTNHSLIRCFLESGYEISVHSSINGPSSDTICPYRNRGPYIITLRNLNGLTNSSL